MSNEQLIRQYYDGDEAALEKLYYKNIGLIRGIAKEAAAEFNCLMVDEHHPNQFSAYTKTILDDLCGEGALELLTRIQSKEYDESRAVLTTYLYPHLKGRMTRWLEQNIGCMALSKDEMAAVRQAQRLYHVAWKDTGEIAEELGISEARVSRYVRYNTHFLDHCFIFQGQFCHFCSIHRNGEVEDNLPDPVAIRLLFREQLDSLDKCPHKFFSLHLGGGFIDLIERQQ